MISEALEEKVQRADDDIALSFNIARRTIAGFEAMLWLRKGFGLSGGWTVNNQYDLLARLFGLQKVNKV